MRAIVITRPGGPDVLALRDVADPLPGTGEIRVRVHATAVNRADLLQRMGRYPAPAGAPQDIPGLEYAGVVDAIGEGAQRWRAGDRVMGLVGGGGYADYIVTHEDEAMRVPSGLSLEDAAAIPEAFITAHDALFTRLGLQRGESLLIHAVGSGVGTAALQLAKAHDVLVIGTQRSGWKLERAQPLGLDVGIETDAASFADRVLSEVHTARATEGVDAVLDLVGGDYLAGNLRAIRVLGRIVVVGLVAGAKSELDMRLLLQKRATITGTVLRARSLVEKVEAVRAFERDVMPLLETAAVRPIIDTVLPLEDVVRAHELVEGDGNFGKVVLTV
ncbi:MAG: NAD(P)H-quinone oxidoreductase [Gemmatimonadetes bacterium]|nr:NAD(P)H-quinone oxidoreductase [Gemmatimonadota bacterium]